MWTQKEEFPSYIVIDDNNTNNKNNNNNNFQVLLFSYN